MHYAAAWELLKAIIVQERSRGISKISRCHSMQPVVCCPGVPWRQLNSAVFRDNTRAALLNTGLFFLSFFYPWMWWQCEQGMNDREEIDVTSNGEKWGNLREQGWNSAKTAKSVGSKIRMTLRGFNVTSNKSFLWEKSQWSYELRADFIWYGGSTDKKRDQIKIRKF